MEKIIHELEGITYREWQKIKLVVDNRFSEIEEKSTFSATEDTLEHLKIIS